MKLATNPTLLTADSQDHSPLHLQGLDSYKPKEATSPTLLHKRPHRLMSGHNKNGKPASGTRMNKVTSVRSSLNGKTPEMSGHCNSKLRKINMRIQRLKSKDDSAPSTDLKLHESDRSDDLDSVNASAVTKKNYKAGRRGAVREQKETLPPRTIDESQEDEIIRILEMQQRQLLEQDPMKELEEALMDRTTASQNRRQRITSINPPTIILPEIGHTGPNAGL